MGVWLLWLLLVGCDGDEPIAAVDPPATETLEEVTSSLREAMRLAATGQRVEARAQWVQAYQTFDTHVTPALRARMDPLEVARIEHQFARIHAELGQTRSPGSQAVRDLEAALQEAFPGS